MKKIQQVIKRNEDNWGNKGKSGDEENMRKRKQRMKERTSNDKRKGE